MWEQSLSAQVDKRTETAEQEKKKKSELANSETQCPPGYGLAPTYFRKSGPVYWSNTVICRMQSSCHTEQAELGGESLWSIRLLSS